MQFTWVITVKAMSFLAQAGYNWKRGRFRNGIKCNLSTPKAYIRCFRWSCPFQLSYFNEVHSLSHYIKVIFYWSSFEKDRHRCRWYLNISISIFEKLVNDRLDAFFVVRLSVSYKQLLKCMSTFKSFMWATLYGHCLRESPLATKVFSLQNTGLYLTRH